MVHFVLVYVTLDSHLINHKKTIGFKYQLQLGLFLGASSIKRWSNSHKHPENTSNMADNNYDNVIWIYCMTYIKQYAITYNKHETQL